VVVVVVVAAAGLVVVVVVVLVEVLVVEVVVVGTVVVVVVGQAQQPTGHTCELAGSVVSRSKNSKSGFIGYPLKAVLKDCSTAHRYRLLTACLPEPGRV
jgi:hypothetical protein